jgi:hypothetical protein
VDPEAPVIEVRLTSNDIRWAMQVGQVRWRRAKQKGSKARFKDAKEEHHLIGAAGELAFCRALDLPWPASVDSYSDEGKPDVYPNWEVRCSPRMKGVKVTPQDHPDRLVVWVTGDVPTKDPLYQIMGYMRAGGAQKRDEWFSDRYGKDRAFWKVPVYNMVPINPDFHRLCGFMKMPSGRFACAFCGKDSQELSMAGRAS